MQQVLLLGKSNVGKSTLFNLLVGRREAITSNQANTTRDLKVGLVGGDSDSKLLLVDSCGLGSKRNVAKHSLLELTNKNVWNELNHCSGVLFVVDAGNLDAEDLEFAGRLRRFLAGERRMKCLFCANKVDAPLPPEPLKRLYHLGFGKPLLLSCKTSKGLFLLRKQLQTWASEPFDDKPKRSVADGASFAYTLSILGRPNVGKSTLINALTRTKSALVSNELGTTRDAVVRYVHFNGKGVRVVDTAGLRRFSKRKDNIENLAVGKTIDAINKSDVVLLLLDALEGITDQDKKIIDLVRERKKSLFLAVNKVDLLGAHPKSWPDLRHRMKYQLPHAKHLKVVKLSAKDQPTSSRRKVLLEAEKLFEERHRTFKTSELNDLLGRMMDSNVSAGAHGKSLKVYYGVQVQKAPLKIRIYVNNRKLIRRNVERYLQRGLMQSKNITGSNLELEFIDKEQRKT